VIVVPFTIPIGTAISQAVRISDGYVPCSIWMPAAWTAADIAFDVAFAPDGTYQRLYDDTGAHVGITVAAGRTVGIGTGTKALALQGVEHVKVRSVAAAGTADANQAAAATGYLICGRL
jgi:hypothetical protein